MSVALLGWEGRSQLTAQVAHALVAQARPHDLTALGATRERLLQQLPIGSEPESLASQVSGVVMITKLHLEITSWVSCWFRRQ